MKKISMLFMATAMMAFVACGGEKKTEPATDSVAVEEPAAVAETPAQSSDIVTRYQELADKMVELAPKMKSGDMAAVEEYKKVAEEFANFADANKDAWANLSEADLAKISEIAQKAAAAMQ